MDERTVSRNGARRSFGGIEFWTSADAPPLAHRDARQDGGSRGWTVIGLVRGQKKFAFMQMWAGLHCFRRCGPALWTWSQDSRFRASVVFRDFFYFGFLIGPQLNINVMESRDGRRFCCEIFLSSSFVSFNVTVPLFCFFFVFLKPIQVCMLAFPFHQRMSSLLNYLLIENLVASLIWPIACLINFLSAFCLKFTAHLFLTLRFKRSDSRFVLFLKNFIIINFSSLFSILELLFDLWTPVLCQRSGKTGSG